MRAVFASACLTTFVRASCVIRKSAVSSSGGRRVAGREVDLEHHFRAALFRGSALPKPLRAGDETKLVERRRTEREG